MHEQWLPETELLPRRLSAGPQKVCSDLFRSEDAETRARGGCSCELSTRVEIHLSPSVQAASPVPGVTWPGPHSHSLPEAIRKLGSF